MLEVKGDGDVGGEAQGRERPMYTIGDVAARAGVATSALRFYEANALIRSERNEGGHRRYRADVLRRVAFIKVAQRVGFRLDEIRSALELLPAGRTPNRSDWAMLASSWQPILGERIAILEAMQEQLDSCIGCGCLSLDKCALYNPDDFAATRGAGPRYLLGDTPPTS